MSFPDDSGYAQTRVIIQIWSEYGFKQPLDGFRKSFVESIDYVNSSLQEYFYDGTKGDNYELPLNLQLLGSITNQGSVKDTKQVIFNGMKITIEKSNLEVFYNNDPDSNWVTPYIEKYFKLTQFQNIEEAQEAYENIYNAIKQDQKTTFQDFMKKLNIKGLQVGAGSPPSPPPPPPPHSPPKADDPAALKVKMLSLEQELSDAKKEVKRLTTELDKIQKIAEETEEQLAEEQSKSEGLYTRQKLILDFIENPTTAPEKDVKQLRSFFLTFFGVNPTAKKTITSMLSSPQIGSTLDAVLTKKKFKQLTRSLF